MLALVAVLGASLVPCVPAEPGTRLDLVEARSEAAPAWLLPGCPCGCEHRPAVAGVPAAAGLALRTAAPALAALPGWSPVVLPAPHPASVDADAPDPVPLVV